MIVMSPIHVKEQEKKMSSAGRRAIQITVMLAPNEHDFEQFR